jgi:hypothetical protein
MGLLDEWIPKLLTDSDGSDPSENAGSPPAPVMPLTMVPGLLDDPDNNPYAGAYGQGQSITQALPQLNTPVIGQMNGIGNGLSQLAMNKINLPATPSGAPINVILSPDPSQPDENDGGSDGAVVDSLRWINGELRKIRKPLPPPTLVPEGDLRGQMIYDYPVLADRVG